MDLSWEGDLGKQICFGRGILAEGIFTVNSMNSSIFFLEENLGLHKVFGFWEGVCRLNLHLFGGGGYFL